MKSQSFVYGFVYAVVAAVVVAAGPAFASTDTYVATNGSDAAACTAAAPCLSFGKALSLTDIDGIVHCIDGIDDTSKPTITKTVTIDCSNTTAVATRFTINTAGIAVHIRGLRIWGGGVGIDFMQGTALYVEDCDIYLQTYGILFEPTNKGAQLIVKNTFVHDNVGVGILAAPPAGGQGIVFLDGARLTNNANEGFRAAGASGGSIQATVRNSVANFNVTQGFGAATIVGGTGHVTMKIDSSESSYNLGDGVRSNASTVFVGSSTISGNNAFGFNPVNGGTIFSYGNNINVNNTTNGAPTSTLALQ